MNETEVYIADQIRLNVWSGLSSMEDVQGLVSELLEDDANESMLRELVTEEFKTKYEAERNWPEKTDYNRLETAFTDLSEKGIIAMHNAGWDKSEAFHNCLDAYREAGSPKDLFGICFYTSQDVESAINGLGLWIGFSSTRAEDEGSDAPRAAKLIVEELQSAGLSVEWDGVASSRIKVLMKWQLRSF